MNMKVNGKSTMKGMKVKRRKKEGTQKYISKPNNRCGRRFCHEMGCHDSVGSKKQPDLSLRTRCVVPKQSQKPEGTFPSIPALPTRNWFTEIIVLGMKRVAVAPFELKLSPNGSYRRTASI